METVDVNSVVSDSGQLPVLQRVNDRRARSDGGEPTTHAGNTHVSEFAPRDTMSAARDHRQ